MGTRTAVIKLGPAYAGLSLQAQPIDTSGADQGSPIGTGFVELQHGEYLFTTNSTQTLFVIQKSLDSSYLTAASIEDPNTNLSFSVAVTPMTTTLVSPNTNEKRIRLIQNTASLLAFSVVDADGDPVDLTGHDLVLTVYNDFSESQSIVFTVGNPTIDANTATFSITTTHTASPLSASYSFRDNTAATVPSLGTFEVIAVP